MESRFGRGPVIMVVGIATCICIAAVAAVVNSSSQGNRMIAWDMPEPTVYAGFQNDTGEDVVFYIGSRRSGFSNPPCSLTKRAK